MLICSKQHGNFSGANYQVTSCQEGRGAGVVPVSLEESPEDAHPEDPQGLLARPGVLGSLPLAEAGVTTLPPGLVIDTGTGPAG